MSASRCGSLVYDASVKRHLLTLALFLCLGAVLNVAVAWACAQGHTDLMNIEEHPLSLDDLRWWNERAPHGFPPSPVGILETYGFGQTVAMLWELEESVHDTLGDTVGRFRTGWPMHSTERSLWVERTQCVTVDQDAARIPLWRSAKHVVVPLRPLWLGFAVNTLFFAIVAASVRTSIVALRRHIRSRRGQCPACGYPVGVSAVCTECGRAVSPTV